MKKKALIGLIILVCITWVLSAETTEKKTDPTSLFFWTILISLSALTVAAIAGIIGQSRAFCSASDNIARNPAATQAIRGMLILGLVLMESLVIYVLLIDLILIFIKWGKYTVS